MTKDCEAVKMENTDKEKNDGNAVDKSVLTDEEIQEIRDKNHLLTEKEIEKMIENARKAKRYKALAESFETANDDISSKNETRRTHILCKVAGSIMNGDDIENLYRDDNGNILRKKDAASKLDNYCKEIQNQFKFLKKASEKVGRKLNDDDFNKMLSVLKSDEAPKKVDHHDKIVRENQDKKELLEEKNTDISFEKGGRKNPFVNLEFKN